MTFRRTSAGAILLLAVTAFATIGCGTGDEPPTASIAPPAESNPQATEAAEVPSAALSGEQPVASVAPKAPKKNLFPEVLIETSLGDIRARLNAEKAPLTVDNFLEGYVDREFYSGTVFHYVDEGMVIGGGYTEDMEPKEVLAPIFNEAATTGLKNKRGTIAMYRMADYADSATSQFFINLVDDESLDYDEESDNPGYCVFGKVIEGMDVVDAMAKVETRDGDFPTPAKPIVIHSIQRVSE